MFKLTDKSKSLLIIRPFKMKRGSKHSLLNNGPIGHIHMISCNIFQIHISRVLEILSVNID